MKNNYAEVDGIRFLAAFSVIFTLAAFASAQNTGVPAIDTLPKYDWDIKTENNSLPLTLGASLIFPGGGQFYTGHYVRGGFLAAFELALGYETLINKPRQKKDRMKTLNSYRDSIAIAQKSESPETASSYKKMYMDAEKKYKAERDLLHSERAWLYGLHLYGLFDAYGIWRNNQGHNHETHSAFSAVWRAAIFPGWGQIYNDEWGKAGLLYMGFLGSAVSWWSRQEMVDYHLKLRRIAVAEKNSAEISRTTEDILFFRKKRNQYIWAISLFYIYSMADAAVDAMLHDFDSPAYLVFSPTEFFNGVRAEMLFDF